MNSTIYVTGHVNPDTDSIAAAYGYAWLLRERDGADTVAARAGAINQQTAWVLKTLDLEPPMLLSDASPRFESVMHRFDTTAPDRPLYEAWGIASRTGGIAPVLNPNGTPYGLITGESLFSFFSRQVGPNPRRQEMKINELLDLPCKQAADTKVPVFQSSTRIRDVLSRLLRVERNEFFVVNEAEQYLGVCLQRDLLNPPRLKLILVDHNEPQQAVGSLGEAELLEILDHHRLGNPSTFVPIKFTVDVVGSTSTLVSEMIETAGLSAPPPLAGLMLAGLLSDTLILTSPTTTERDRRAADRLARWAFVCNCPLQDETIETFGKKVLGASSGISTRSSKEVVSGDMKIYSAGGYQFSISQAEVSDLYELDDHVSDLNQGLEELRESKGLEFTILMVTDVVRGSSRLLTAGAPSILDELPYPPQADGTRLAAGVVSRKKQLLPGVLGLLEA